MKWLCVIYSPLLKGWMSVCKSVCVCACVCVCTHMLVCAILYVLCVRAGVCAYVQDFLPLYMCVFMYVGCG